MESKRINYLDLIKAISIFLVVNVHYTWTNGSTASNLSLMICIIAVPLFFMVNGALLLNHEFNLKKHLLKILKIYIGVVAFKLLIFLIFYIIGIRSNIGKIEFINCLFFNKGFPNVPTEHFWFIFSLLKVYLILPFIKVSIDKSKNACIYILILLFAFSFLPEFVNTLNIYFFKIKSLNPFIINNSLSPLFDCEYLFYFVAGYVLHKKYYKTKLNKKSIIIIISLMIISVCGLIFLKILQDGSISGQYHGISNRYIKISNILLSSSIFLLFAKLELRNSKIISFIGSRTMNIYCIHMMIVSLLLKFILPLINITGFFPNIIKTIIAILISLLITELMRRINIIKKIFNLS